MLKHEVASYLEKTGHKQIKYVAATIYGTPMMLSELEVRYLQIKCANLPKGRFKKFVKNHKIHANESRHSRLMVWDEDGYFENSFDNGFYSLNSHLSLELDRISYNKQK